MIYLLRFPAVGGETGKASTRKVLALRLSPPRDNLSRSPILGLGAPSSFFLPRHKTAILGSALPHNGQRRPGGTGGQPVLLRIVAMGWPVPFAALVLFARSRGGSHSAPAARLPALCSRSPVIPLWRRKPPLIYHQKRGGKWSPRYRFFLKYFFMDSMPHRTERRTTLLSTPSSRAISR